MASILENCTRTIRELFESAKVRDEWGYVQNLLHFRGGIPQPRSPLDETIETIRACQDLLEAIPATQIRARLRVALLTYCHSVEAKHVHEVLMNMFRVRKGESYHTDPFEKEYRLPNMKRQPNSGRPPTAKPPTAGRCWRLLGDEAKSAGLDDLAKLLLSTVDDDLRNAFSHSDYVIDERGLVAPNGWFQIGQAWQQVLPPAELEKRINTGLGVVQVTISEIIRGRSSYQSPKSIQAPVYGPGGMKEPVRLIIDPQHGLVGYQL